MKLIKIIVDEMPKTVTDCLFHSAWGRCKILHKADLNVCFSNRCPLAIKKMEETMDNRKDIEEMAKAIYETGVAIDGTDIAFGLMEDSHFHRMAGKLYNAGYRLESEVRKETAREILNKIYDEIEKARLESEFQDENGKWLIDESEFMSEFTLGKLYELYAEYSVEVKG